MKQLTKKQKIVIFLTMIILIAGIAMTLIKGLNFDLKYEQTQKVELYLEQEINNEEIKQITDEVFGNKTVMIQKVEVYKDTVTITAKEITEEEKNNLITKVNEKYGLELKAEEIEVTNVPHTRGREIIFPYVMPFIISVVIILAYMAVRYRKLGIGKVLGNTILTLVVTQALLFSIIAITRIPVGRLTIPMVLSIYMLSLIGITSGFEKQLDKKKEKEKEEK